MPRRRSLTLLVALTLAGCTMSTERWIKHAMPEAKAIPSPAQTLDPEATEVRSRDGTLYRIQSSSPDGICFLTTLDNRRPPRWDAQAFELDVYRDPTGDPSRTWKDPKRKLLKEYTTEVRGAVRTNTYVVDPDGRLGNVIQMGTVDYPVADVELCFPGQALASKPSHLVLRRVRSTDGLPASFAIWKIR